MKTNHTESKSVPVPRWGRKKKEKSAEAGRKIIVSMICILLAAVSAYAGAQSMPEETEIPVVLSNGEVITPPWYIMVDGKKVALVESKDAAEKAVENVIEAYQKDDGAILDVEVVEETETQQMEISSGDAPPNILTVKEAERALMHGEDGYACITVITTVEERSQESIAFEEEYKPEPDLYVGEKQVETEGKAGTKEVTRKIVKENGEPVEEEILEEEILAEPVEQVVLTGTKNYDGYGGSDTVHYDEGVSYNLEATYDMLHMPIDRVNISSDYGARWGRMHKGIDFALAQGSAIRAADSGIVYFSGNSDGYGNLVKIDHGNGMQTYYAHCSQLLVSEGQQVSRGEKIALVGSTGNSTGPHLHFEVIINGGCVDPASFLELE